MSTIATRVAALAAATAAAGVLAVGAAGSASAQQYLGTRLQPSQNTCVSQYASYQFQATGTASDNGARFKVLYNGQIVRDSYGRVGYFIAEGRSSYGTFPGPGYYSLCAFNTGSAKTDVTLNLRTDGEVW